MNVTEYGRLLVNALGQGVYRFRDGVWEFRSDFDKKWVVSNPLVDVSYEDGRTAIGQSDVAKFEGYCTGCGAMETKCECGRFAEDN